jgi:hypothetical protein
MKVLVACEFSGRVRDKFLRDGHDAVSCDLLFPLGPGPHIQDDVLNHLDEKWDLMIAHPDCTYLCTGGLNWNNREPGRIEKQDLAVNFVQCLMDAPIPRIVIENPIGKLSTRIRKPDQILRAWQFGEIYKKDICLWLKNVPPLVPLVDKKPPSLKTFDFGSKKRHFWNGGNKKSVTFRGVADAMAEQWGIF